MKLIVETMVCSVTYILLYELTRIMIFKKLIPQMVSLVRSRKLPKKFIITIEGEEPVEWSLKRERRFLYMQFGQRSIWNLLAFLPTLSMITLKYFLIFFLYLIRSDGSSRYKVEYWKDW